MATNTNKTAIIVSIIGIAGVIVGVAVSLSMAHVSNFAIHTEKDNIVTKSEFNQFQQRILDGIDNIQTTQQELRQDIKDVERSLNDR